MATGKHSNWKDLVPAVPVVFVSDVVADLANLGKVGRCVKQKLRDDRGKLGRYVKQKRRDDRRKVGHCVKQKRRQCQHCS